MRGVVLAVVGLCLGSGIVAAEELAVRNVVAHNGSVYAFVARATDYESAKAFCERFEWPARSDAGKPEAIRDFHMVTLDSKAERDWVHAQVFAPQGGLNQYTWAGELAYRGAPTAPEGQRMIFGVWNDSRGLIPWPDTWSSAFVCEARTRLSPGPVARSPRAADGGTIRDDVLLYKGHLYVFATRGRTYQQAIDYCNSLERRFDGAGYPSFQLLRLDDLEEQRQVHALIQQNGGAWTWAGQVLHAQAPRPVAGYQLVFTQWDRPDVLTLQPEQNRYSVVCESVGSGSSGS